MKEFKSDYICHINSEESPPLQNEDPDGPYWLTSHAPPNEKTGLRIPDDTAPSYLRSALHCPASLLPSACSTLSCPPPTLSLLYNLLSTFCLQSSLDCPVNLLLSPCSTLSWQSPTLSLFYIVLLRSYHQPALHFLLAPTLSLLNTVLSSFYPQPVLYCPITFLP